MSFKKICLTTLLTGVIGIGGCFAYQCYKAYRQKGNIAWGEVVKENKLESHEQFVAQYSIHSKTKEAKHKSNKLRFAEVREAYATLNDIDGATYDREVGWPILFAKITKEKSNLPPMNLDNLVVAIEVVKDYDNPGVSIEPPGMGTSIVYTSVPDHQNVRYIPNKIKNTHLGMRLFEADRTLKALGFGKDPLNHKPVSSNIKGFKTLPKLAREDKDLKMGYFGRIWFKPKEVSLNREGNTISFNQVIMDVESESPYPAPSKFASHLENHYNQFASEKPIYKELLRITKEVAIARWLVEENYIGNLSDYKVQNISTPNKTDTLQGVVRETRSGMQIRQEVLIGGVTLDMGNKYLSGKNVYVGGVSLSNLKNSILNVRPEKTAITWDFTIDNKKYKAVALPF